MNKARFFNLLVLLTITVIITACQPGAALTPAATPAVSRTLFASLSGTPGIATPPLQPTQYLEFSNLSEAQKAAKFSIWLPGFIPDDLPLYKAWISDYADGSENVRIFYQEPGAPLDANLKSLDIQMTETNQPVTLDSVTHQFKETALDVCEVPVRGQAGYSYWTPAVAAGNSAVLTWREGTVNIRISLSGDWPEPDASHPHGLDSTLLKIAESLQTMPSTLPTPAVTVQVLPPTAPTATPDCQPIPGVTIEVQRLGATTAILHASGLQPGEVPFVFYSTSINGVGAKRGEAWGFVKGANEHGEFSLELTGLQPLEGQTKATWDIRLVHARGVACTEITMPSKEELRVL
jgi:hypothetical protein